MIDRLRGGRVDMKDDEKRIYDRLLDKSLESFVLALEIYNRPSIRYRVEGFSFFICNAWVKHRIA